VTPFRLLSSLSIPLFLAACGSVNELGQFDLSDTPHAAVSSFRPVVDGNWMVYLAIEGDTGPSGTDLNSDMDTDDVVAVAVEITSRRVTSTEVAAVDGIVVGEQVFLVVDEALYGSNLQTVDTGDALVLVHWSRDNGDVTFLDTLPPAMGVPCLTSFQNRLYYASGEALVGSDATSIRYVASNAPTVVVPITSAGEGQFEATILAEHDGLIFCALRERAGEGDLNEDGDEDDVAILGLLDGEEAPGVLRNVGLAMPALSTALDARETAAGDWLVAFLVSEEEQNEDFNDPGLFDGAWLPEACPGLAADGIVAGQNVLFYLRYAEWLTGSADPINTGVVGSGRVVALDDHVATVTSEAQIGCDLNGDGSTDDLIPRWVEAVAADDLILPSGAIAEQVALAQLPGGAQGLAALRTRFVISVSEADDGRDFDGKPEQNNLIASRDPGDSDEGGWVFEHRSGVGEVQGDFFVTTEPYVGASWMADEETATRLPIAYEERVSGLVLNRNVDCNEIEKDADATDSVAAWPRLRSELERNTLEPDHALTFPGLGYAVVADNPGFVVINSIIYFRVSETEDARDYNGDEDTDDICLFRTPLGSGCPIEFVSVTDATPGPVATGSTRGVGFLAVESMEGVDFNEDGDILDTVVRFLIF